MRHHVHRVAAGILALCLTAGGVGAAQDQQTNTPTGSNATLALPRASVDLPPGWERQTPKSAMRAAQASIPGAGGAGELTVFYFGEGQGGGVEANIQRWVGQMDVAAGKAPVRAKFESHGFTITWIDVVGTLKPSTMGMGPSSPQPNTRMLAAVIEGPGGPWFFRATGPDGTISAQRDAFMNMLKSVRSN